MKEIIKGSLRSHSKASERYIDTLFNYELKQGQFLSLETAIPIEYRRTGTFIEDGDIDEYIYKVYNEIHPSNWSSWKKDQDFFWSSKNSKVTKQFFDKLVKKFNWCCVACDLPQNPNWARRIQDLKEYGYTIATNTNRNCLKCGKGTTHIILIPIKRGGITGYEFWSPNLRKKIITLLKSYDAFEGKMVREEGLLPDHKFPEIRWDNYTRRDALDMLTDDEILNDFQLMSNQRNQQKREVCRKCYQTNKRGSLYGIRFFYEGNEEWNPNIPKRGKRAEAGCVGCGWYDLEKWRREITKKLRG